MEKIKKYKKQIIIAGLVIIGIIAIIFGKHLAIQGGICFGR